MQSRWTQRTCPWESISHILHQNNSFGSRLRGIQGNITENSQHLILSPSFCKCFFLFVCFSFFFFNDEYWNLRCVVPRSARLCCLVSVMTLKSYFTLHNAHFLSFLYLFIYLPVAVQYHYFPPEWKRSEMTAMEEEKERRKSSLCQLFPPILDSSENSVTLSIILN